MTARSEKDQVLADYSAFLTALLPQTEGFFCHDRRGQLFWFDNAELVRRFEDDASYLAALERTLDVPDSTAQAMVRVGEHAALLLSLDDRSGNHHGAMSIVVPAREELPVDFTVAVLQPALRTLCRELTLRYRLMATRRKLAVQADEEKLLHHLESLVHDRRDSATTVARILELCRSYLAVAQAGIAIPGKQLHMLQADGLDDGEAQQQLAQLLQLAGANGADDCLILPVGSADGATPGHLVLSGWGKSDFSGRRRRRLARYIASHIESVIARDFDPLTGLLSWPVFETRLDVACQSGSDCAQALMYLDIDQLHVINENYGRPAGDEVLGGLAQVLQDCLPDCAVTRISSNSFGALIPRGDLDTVRDLGEQICDRFRSLAFSGGGKSFRASVSIGIAPLQPGEDGSSAIVAAAQVACRAAKDRGTGRVEIYEPADQSIVRRMGDIHLVSRVREAIEQDRLLLLGQPICSLRNDDPFQYQEVLVRMLDEEGRQVEPAEFIPAAERYQLMKELDRWVVSRSLEALRASGMTGRSAPARLAINLSGQSLGDENFLRFLRAQFRENGIAPALICFEITETVAVANLQRAQSFMHALKRIGCRFSLDDFGTGLSSFAYLKLFPVDTLKIDGSFVQDLATNKVSQSVVAAISEVARVMHLETVAEFVQDHESLELLRGLGVNWGQGYLLGEPAPLAEQLRHPGTRAASDDTSRLTR